MFTKSILLAILFTITTLLLPSIADCGGGKKWIGTNSRGHFSTSHRRPYYRPSPPRYKIVFVRYKYVYWTVTNNMRKEYHLGRYEARLIR